MRRARRTDLTSSKKSKTEACLMFPEFPSNDVVDEAVADEITGEVGQLCHCAGMEAPQDEMVSRNGTLVPENVSKIAPLYSERPLYQPLWDSIEGCEKALLPIAAMKLP